MLIILSLFSFIPFPSIMVVSHCNVVLDHLGIFLKVVFAGVDTRIVRARVNFFFYLVDNSLEKQCPLDLLRLSADMLVLRLNYVGYHGGCH